MLRNFSNLKIFKKKWITCIFKCHDPTGIKTFTRLRQGLSYLSLYNSNAAFKIHKIQFTGVKQILRLHVSVPFTAPTIEMKNWSPELIEAYGQSGCKLKGFSNQSVNFNANPTEQTREVILSCKTEKLLHPPLLFNNPNVTQLIYQKHIGIILDSKLTFENPTNKVTTKKNKFIRILRKQKNLLPRNALITIYKAFVRPHLDYGDVLYDEIFNLSFKQKLKSIQYRACLVITGAIQGI